MSPCQGRCASPSSTTSSAFGMSAASCSPARSRIVRSPRRCTTSVGTSTSASVSRTSVANVSSSRSAAISALAELRWNAANDARSSPVPLGTNVSASIRLPRPQCLRTSSFIASRATGRRELGAVRERAVEDEPVDALAVARRVDGGRAAGERAADEAEPAELAGGRRARRAWRARTRASSSRAAARDPTCRSRAGRSGSPASPRRGSP